MSPPADSPSSGGQPSPSGFFRQYRVSVPSSVVCAIAAGATAAATQRKQTAAHSGSLVAILVIGCAFLLRDSNWRCASVGVMPRRKLERNPERLGTQRSSPPGALGQQSIAR